MSPFEILHPALHALPDVMIAVDPTTIRVVDVNRSEAFGLARDALVTMGLDDLLDVPRAELERFVMAADGHALDVGIRSAAGPVLHATARAATSAAAASRPCVIVVLREAPEHARVLDEIARLETVLSEASAALGRLASARRPAPVEAEPEAEIEDSAIVEEVAPWIPELSLAQYASFCVEHELNPVNARETDARYGLPTEVSRAALHRVWGERLKADPALGAQFKMLSAQYGDWYVAQQRAREATMAQSSGIVAFTAPASPSNAPASQSTAPQAPASQSSQQAQGAAVSSRSPEALDGRKAQRTTAPAAPDPRAAALPWGGTDSASAAIAQASATATLPGGIEISEAPSLNVRATIGVNEALAQGQALPFRPDVPPDLTVEQFAALGVELEAYPDRRLDVLSMYGISSDAAWKSCDAQWTARFAADGTLRQKWLKLSNDLRGKLVRK